MTDTSAPATPQEIYGLLPWYVTGTLGKADRERVERALAADPNLRASLARIEEERDETVLLNQAVPGPRAGAIDALMARIEAEAPRRDRSATRENGVLARLLGALGGLQPRTLALAGFAAALVIVAESGALISQFGHGASAPAQYTTASVEPVNPADQAVLLVSFTDTASLSAVSALLRADSAMIVDGPRAGGIFRIAVPAASRDSVLADLKSHTDLIRFAAPGK